MFKYRVRLGQHTRRTCRRCLWRRLL